MPQNDAGQRTDPPVSEPREQGASPPATQAALPPLEPPGTQSISQGFLVGPKALVSVEVPMANSSILVLPMIMAPSARKRSITWASYGGMYPCRILELQLLSIPLVDMHSLMAMGTPARSPFPGF
ncbi:MAG: hypothetical protein A4E43_00601 [Methanosaeta sp. PtaB.Bin005]|nr:MAG: hypothetical protein A4E43_00601 [Methanosaeta sp. PtaB.Bin005]